MIRKIFLLIISLCITRVGYSQSLANNLGENSVYFYRMTDKPFSELTKDEVAFVYKGENYYIKGNKIFKKRVDKDKLRQLSYGEYFELMGDCPQLETLVHKSRTCFIIGAAWSAGCAAATSAGVLVGVIPASGPLVFLGISASKRKKAIKAFYEDYLCKLPNDNRTLSLDYEPETFVKLTDKRAKDLKDRHFREVAFTYDGVDYYIFKSKAIIKSSKYFRWGSYPLNKKEVLELMSHQGNYSYSKKEIARFYAEMNTDPNVNANRKKPEYVPTLEPVKATEPVVEQQPQAAVEEEEILENVEANETTPAVAEPAKAEAKPEPKPEKVKPEPAPKPVREPQPKLNERKRDGFGMFFNVGGFAFSGPEVGVEIRRNKFIPSFYIGFPHMGSGFKNKHDDLSSLKSVAIGAGAKGLIPMSCGGFYLGGILQYRRYAADKDASTMYSQKVLSGEFGILANAGIRLQTRSNLYFNIGGSVGPMFKSTQSRYTNKLLNSYSPKYKKGDSETIFSGRCEISIGYEF